MPKSFFFFRKIIFLDLRKPRNVVAVKAEV